MTSKTSVGNPTDYVRESIFTGYDDIIARSVYEGWFGYIQVASHVNGLSGLEIERELMNLARSGFLQSMPLIDFPGTREYAEKHPEQAESLEGNMYKINPASREWQEYAERTQNHASSE